MGNRLEGGGQHLLLRPAEDFAEPSVDREETAGYDIDLRHTHRRLLEECAEPRFAFPQ